MLHIKLYLVIRLLMQMNIQIIILKQETYLTLSSRCYRNNNNHIASDYISINYEIPWFVVTYTPATMTMQHISSK